MSTPIRSLWTRQKASPPARISAPLTRDRSADVVVVGGGVAGLTVAEHLAGDGADVVVLERNAIGGGVTSGSTAKVTALHGTLLSTIRDEHGPEAAAIYSKANVAAVESLAATVERHTIDCGFARADAVNYAVTPTGLEHLDRDVEAATAAGLNVVIGEDADLPFPVTGVARLADQAHVHPLLLCQGLADAVGRDAIHEDTPVVAIEEDDDGCRVETPGGTIRAADVVIATHGPVDDPRFLLNRCRPTRSYALVVTLDADPPPDMFLSVDEPVRSLRPALVAGPRQLVVGGEGHPVGDEADARDRLDALEAWAREHFPVVAVGERWAAHDHVPSDHLPFIGRQEPGSRRWVATGFQKWGFTNSVVAADVIAAGIAGGEHAAAHLLDPSRVRSTLNRQLASDGLRVVSRFGEDHLAAWNRADPTGSLAPGEGMVASRRGRPIAVCRDSDGTTHTVAAKCTHQGCLVRWNTAQLSWDCPCHGSRFAPDGTVLAGPAVEPLAPIRPAAVPPSGSDDH